MLYYSVFAVIVVVLVAVVVESLLPEETMVVEFVGTASGAGSFSHEGSTPQISCAYSAMVRSEENLPLEAML